MRRTTLLLLALVYTPAFAASPSDGECVAAIDTAGFTGSQRLECATKDMDRADAGLNATYKATMSRLSSARQSALRQEERDWIEHRKAQCAVERQDPNPSRDVNRMLCLVRETDARTQVLQALR